MTYKLNNLWLFAYSVLLTPVVYAHGGGLNAEGCHNNHKTGEYHCHRAPAAKSQQKPEEPSKGTPDNGTPQCHTGPRGGTYTITPSGRKNYKGC